MRKGRTVIGQDVYSLADGSRVHSVKDLLINESNDAIVALLVDEGGLMRTSTVVPIEHVRRFGPNAVMIEDAESVITASDDVRVSAILDRKVSLLGTRVISEEGEDIGRIGDMYFDELSGQISGYEVSGGTVGDAMRGTSYLAMDQIRVVGPDAVIASPEAKAIVDSQVGGLQGALDEAGQRAKSAGEGISEKVSEATSGGTGDDGQPASPPDPVKEDPDGQLVGKRSTMDLVDERGSVVLANGQRVTLDHVQRARAEGNLDPLYQAVGLERPKPVTEKASEAVEQVAATASDLWSRFTAKLSSVTDDAGQQIDARQTKGRLDQIHDAIGRPVTKVFLDRDDTVILDLGDLVTHQAVQRAYDAGMLDSLLSSVYKADVTFERDEMKAQIAGDSTIEQAHGGASVVEELETKVADAQKPKEPPKDEDPEAENAEGAPDQAEEPAADAKAEPETGWHERGPDEQVSDSSPAPEASGEAIVTEPAEPAVQSPRPSGGAGRSGRTKVSEPGV